MRCCHKILRGKYDGTVRIEVMMEIDVNEELTDLVMDDINGETDILIADQTRRDRHLELQKRPTQWIPGLHVPNTKGVTHYPQRQTDIIYNFALVQGS